MIVQLKHGVELGIATEKSLCVANLTAKDNTVAANVKAIYCI